MIVLAWPPRTLHPNARPHWATKSKAVKAYRSAAGWSTKASGDRVDGVGAVDLHITFYPPNKRKHDLDGCLSAIKAGIDGIADALGVDDSRFTIRIERGAVIQGGEVRVIVTDSAQGKQPATTNATRGENNG